MARASLRVRSPQDSGWTCDAWENDRVELHECLLSAIGISHGSDEDLAFVTIQIVDVRDRVWLISFDRVRVLDLSAGLVHGDPDRWPARIQDATILGD